MSITAPLVSNSALISVRRIGVALPDMLALLPADDLGWTQQLRADREIARLGRGYIDLQANVAAAIDEPDHDAPRIGGVGIAYREYAAPLEGSQNRRQVRNLRSRDVQDVAVAHFVDAVITLDDHRMLFDMLATHDRVEIGAEGILTQDADHERGRSTFVRAARPLHELREIEEEDGLHAILGRGGSPAQGGAHPHEQQPQSSHGTPALSASQGCHSTF